MADIDASDFIKKSSAFKIKIENKSKTALGEVANEVLRLSQREVPHDTGQLQNTGSTQPEGDDWLVGYNKVYALRLHEHPEYRFQKGRKGKYLEDPIKMNSTVLSKHYASALTGGL